MLVIDPSFLITFICSAWPLLILADKLVPWLLKALGCLLAYLIVLRCGRIDLIRNFIWCCAVTVLFYITDEVYVCNCNCVLAYWIYLFCLFRISFNSNVWWRELTQRILCDLKAWNIQTSADLSLSGPVGLVYSLVVGNDLLFAGTQVFP